MHTHTCVRLCVAEPVVPAGAQAAAPGSRRHPLQTLTLGQPVLLPTPPPPQAQEVISRWRPSAIVSRWPSDVPDGGEPWALPVGSGRCQTSAETAPLPSCPLFSSPKGSSRENHPSSRAQNPSQALLLGGTSVSLPLSLPCLCVSCGCADVGFSHR